MSSDSKSKLFERLKLSPKRVDFSKTIAHREAIRSILERKEREGEFINVDSESQSKAFLEGFITLETYLADEWLIAQNYLRKFVVSCDEYFFGKWRAEIPSGNRRHLPPDRSYQDRVQLWSNQWAFALVWCSSTGLWDELLHFANYPPDDVMLDPEQSKENRAWLLLIAKVLRGDPREETQPLVDTIFAGRRKREKLLYPLFEAILEGDEESANFALKEYSTYYRATEFPSDDLSKKVAFDASFLVHYAEYRDMEIQVPPKMVDHIVRFPPEVLKDAG